MVDSFFCAVTGHAPAFVCDLRDTALAELSRPSVQDVLEHVAEHHHLRCGCDVKVGTRVWLTSIPLSDVAECVRKIMSTDCLSADAYLNGLPRTAEPSTVRLVIAGEEAPSVDYLRSYREKNFVSICIGHGRVFTRYGATPFLPPQSSLQFNEFCSIPGATFVDKSAPLRALLRDYGCSAISIVRRPKGFGKTTLLSMFDAFFDPFSPHAYFPFTFSDPSIPVVRAHGQVLVFALDFARLSFKSSMYPNELAAECDRLLDAGAQQFYARYAELLCAPEEETTRPDFTATFADITRWAMLEQWQLCFTIDNYTAPISDGPNDDYEWAISQRIFEVVYGLQSANVVSSALIVGDDVPHAAQWSGLPPVFVDRTDSPSFADTIGFTSSEILALDQVFPGDLISALEGRAAIGLDANANHIYAASDVLALARWLAGLEHSAPVHVRTVAFDPLPAIVPLPAPPSPPTVNAIECAMDDDEEIDWEEEMDLQFGRWFGDDDRGEGDSDQPPLTSDSSSDGSSLSVPSPEAKPLHPPVAEPPSPSQRYDKKFRGLDSL